MVKYYMANRHNLLFSLYFLIVYLALVRTNLYIDTYSFKDSMLKNYSAELSRSDTFALTQKLTFLINQDTVTEISAFYRNNRFYFNQKSICSSPLWCEAVVLSSKYNADIKVHITRTLSKSTIISSSIIFFLALIAFYITMFRFAKQQSLLVQAKEDNANLKFSLASSVAHDIRSPIAVLEAALSEKKIDDTLVRQAANRLKCIADGLLKERKGGSVSSSINTILENLIREKSVEHPHHKISPILKEDHLLTKDATGLVRALSNFINNAVEASPRGSEILITHLAGMISIQDKGCGLTKEQLEKIGTAPIETTKQNGNGLGVYSSVEAIKELGGKVTFSSLLNAGTTVTITFNRAENIVTSKIVLVDDDDLIRMVWTSRAKKRGENFRAYAAPKDLLQEINLYTPETIFYLDVNIKEESGVDLAEKLFAMGFHELYLATGEDKEKFEGLTFIKGVVGKDGT